MADEKFDPVREFVQIRDQLGRAVERSIRTVTGPAGFPAVDIYEDDDNLYIRTEPIAGLQPASIDISIEDHILTIAGTTADEPTDARFLYRELQFGTFSRKIRLPRPVDVQQTKAQLKNKTIIITMPRVKQSTSKIVDVTPAQ